MQEEILNSILDDVLKKKELSIIDREIASRYVRYLIGKRTDLRKLLEKAYSKEDYKRTSAYKKVVKECRAFLREVFGVYIHQDIERIDNLVNLLCSEIRERGEGYSKEILMELLKMHASTRERLGYIDKIYEKIEKAIGKPRDILDIGCGLNPFSLLLTSWRNIDVTCTEISPKLCFWINKLFNVAEKIGIKGKCLLKDCILDSMKFNKKFDVVLYMKMLPIVEKVKKGRTWEIVEEVDWRFFVISYSEKSLGRVKFRSIGRAWRDYILRSMPHSLLAEFSIARERFFIFERKD